MAKNTNVEETVETTAATVTLNPGEVEITATAPLEDGTKTEASFVVYLGKTAAEAIELFSDSLILDYFIRSARIAAQTNIRAMLRAGKSSAEVSAEMAANWRPGESVSDPTVAIMSKFKNMSTEERTAFIEALQAQAQ